MKQNMMSSIEKLIYYTVVFFILREWLHPIMQLTSTGYFSLFSIFVALCLLTNFLRLPIFVSWIIKVVYIVCFIVYVYNDEQITSLTGSQFLSQELRNNVAVLMSGDWALISDPLRTSLFFILIWMLIYLIHYWITVRMTVFYFFVLTVFFIATLDTFSDYDGSAPIVKVVLLGLMMTAMLFVKRLITTTATAIEWHTYILYVMPAIVFIGMFGMIATVLPKAEPQWPDPVPYVKGITGQGGTGGTNGTVAKVGYGDNDQQLGGAFTADDTVVFEIDTRSKQYWRVETKDMYTSKGWENSAGSNVEVFLQLTDDIPLSATPGETALQSADVTVLGDYSFLLQPYRTVAFDFDEAKYPDGQLRFNVKTEKLNALSSTQPAQLSEYQIGFQQPEYSYTALKETLSSAEEDVRFLQLPNTLPERVTLLAEEITASSESVYDKARAIETYFRRNGFRYDTQNVPIPTEGQDYVDQFLFETKFGYCDNFSTSMVVMLRAIGIQARWVKGFASGEEIARENGIRTYEVTNNDAHSWVEAYIDGIGWMPFEPTIGFTNPVDINYDIEPTEQPEELQEQPEQVEKPEEPKATPKAASTFKLADYKWVLYIVVALLGIGAISLWKYRKKWQPQLVIQRSRNKWQDEDSFEKAYLILLKQLGRTGIKRMPDQTLQDYAKLVDRRLETTKMTELTDAYEQVIYSVTNEKININEVKESWEYLINLTSG